MITIDIALFKYRQTNGEVINFFLQRVPNFLDWMEIKRIPIDGLPKFDDSYRKEDDVNAILHGEFTINFSLMQTEKSYYGFNIKDFLLPDTNRNFRLLCNWILNGNERWGSVDLTNITADYDIQSGKWNISIKVIDLLKEFIDGMRGIMINNDDDRGVIDWIDWLRDYMFANVKKYIEVDDQLDLDTRCDFPVKVDTHLWNSLWHDGLNRGYPVWECLKGFAVGLGFAIRLECVGMETLFNPYRVYPRFKLIMFWRTELEGEEITTVKALGPHTESNSLAYDNHNIIIEYNYMLGNIQPEEYAMGLFIRAEYINVSDAEQLYNGHNVYAMRFHMKDYPNYLYMENMIQQGDKFMVQTSDLLQVNLSVHAQSIIIYAGGVHVNISICRILTKTGYANPGFTNIIEKTAGAEYQYLIAGVKAVHNLEISLIEYEPALFDKIKIVTVRGEIIDKIFWVSRITGYDIKNMKATIEASEC